MTKNTDHYGRPTVITPETLLKLEQAFGFGCTDLEACLFAGIGKSTFYEYQKKNPHFLDRKLELKETPVLKARQAVLDGFESDSKLAFDYLKNKKSDEFSTKTATEVSITPLQQLYSELDGNSADLPEPNKPPE